MPFIKAGRLRHLEATEKLLERIHGMNPVEFANYLSATRLSDTANMFLSKLADDIWQPDSPSTGVTSLRKLFNG